MPFHRVFVCLVLCGAVGPLALAQPPASPAPPATLPPAAPAADLPSGESLFAKHVEAVGGMEGLRAPKSSVAKAKITRPASPTGLLTVWRIAPDKMYKIMDFPGLATIETWCDGENGWIRDSNKGAAKLAGDSLAELKIESQFVGEADFKSRYKELKTTERTTFAQRPVYAVAAVTSLDKPRTLYFDAEKGYLIGVKMAYPGAGPARDLILTFSDYTQFGPCKQPTTVTEDDGRATITTVYSKFEMDVASMPSIEPPPEVKAIKSK